VLLELGKGGLGDEVGLGSKHAEGRFDGTDQSGGRRGGRQTQKNGCPNPQVSSWQKGVKE